MKLVLETDYRTFFVFETKHIAKLTEAFKNTGLYRQTEYGGKFHLDPDSQIKISLIQDNQISTTPYPEAQAAKEAKAEADRKARTRTTEEAETTNNTIP